MHRFPPLALLLFALFAIVFPGCALLVGNVKPVDEKSETYGVLDLTKAGSDWMKLDSSTAAAESNETSDVAYQSRKTASIISLNSSCRTGAQAQDLDLKEYTQSLLLGVADETPRQEKNVQIQAIPALETTVKGKLNGETMMLRALVLRRGECVYDLMYVARPDQFPKQEADFSRFVGSFHVK